MNNINQSPVYCAEAILWHGYELAVRFGAPIETQTTLLKAWHAAKGIQP